MGAAEHIGRCRVEGHQAKLVTDGVDLHRETMGAEPGAENIAHGAILCGCGQALQATVGGGTDGRTLREQRIEGIEVRRVGNGKVTGKRARHRLTPDSARTRRMAAGC